MQALPENALLCIACSGGADSTALLHALASLSAARDHGLRALHVDHGLHPESSHWAEHCRALCESLAVPLHVVRVQVADTRGEGIEAAARRARHAAFAENLRDGEWLATAHHRDDQIETVLLKLLRGAGPEGLGGMRALRPFARGMQWRPLLDAPRAALHDYAEAHGLGFIDDPANIDPRFSRNVLRNDIVPRIAAHWPHAAQSVAHAAEACRTAADFLDGQAQRELQHLRHADAATIDARAWRALPDALRAVALERWLRERDLPAPTRAQRAQLEHQIETAQVDRVPRIAWPGAEIRVWRNRLHAMAPLLPIPDNWQDLWNGSALPLPAGAGMLHLTTLDGEASAARFDPPLTVRFRRGGERIKPANDAHTRELRDLFQRADIAPWLRGRCPLIYAGDELLAVADRWQSAAGAAYFARIGAAPRWAH